MVNRLLQFKKRDKSKEAEKPTQKAQEEHERALNAGKACFASDRFLKYRKAYEAEEKGVLLAILKIDECEYEPIKYMMKMKNLLSELRQTRRLLEKVRVDAGKKVYER